MTVPFTTSGSALNPADYTITGSPVVINAGSTGATVVLTVVNDTLNESNETVIVSIGTPTNATVGATPLHTATINDDDPQPTVQWTAGSQSAPTGAGDAGVKDGEVVDAEFAETK